jgi:hypothetical protein
MFCKCLLPSLLLLVSLTYLHLNPKYILENDETVLKQQMLFGATLAMACSMALHVKWMIVACHLLNVGKFVIFFSTGTCFYIFSQSGDQQVD